MQHIIFIQRKKINHHSLLLFNQPCQIFFINHNQQNTTKLWRINRLISVHLSSSFPFFTVSLILRALCRHLQAEAGPDERNVWPCWWNGLHTSGGWRGRPHRKWPVLWPFPLVQTCGEVCDAISGNKHVAALHHQILSLNVADLTRLNSKRFC